MTRSVGLIYQMHCDSTQKLTKSLCRFPIIKELSPNSLQCSHLHHCRITFRRPGPTFCPVTPLTRHRLTSPGKCLWWLLWVCANIARVSGGWDIGLRFIAFRHGINERYGSASLRSYRRGLGVWSGGYICRGIGRL